MKHVELPPRRLEELPEEIRKFLAGMRDDELGALRYFVENFTKEDLQVMAGGLENLRAGKRFTRYALFLFGGLVTIGGGIAALRAFFSMAPK